VTLPSDPRGAALHGVRRLLSGAAAAGCAGYGVWSWLRGPRARFPLDPDSIHRILVIRVDLLGDLVFSLPALEALRAAFPRARIDALVLPYAAEILADLAAVDRVYQLDVNRYRRPREPAELRHLLAAIRDLRAEHYDLAVSLSGAVGGVLAVASGAPIRLGYVGDSYAGCFNAPVRGHRYDRPVHEVDYELNLLQAIGVPVTRARPGLSQADHGRGEPSELTASRSFEPSAPPYAVIVPGASNGSAKRWPARHWAVVGDHLASERGLEIVLAGAASERALAAEVANAMSAPLTNRVGTTSIGELRGLLAGAALVLAGDTGPLHLASALGRPVVGVYGPTDPTNTGPLASTAAVVRLGLACSPCYDLRSPADCKLPDRSIACMVNLEPARVLAAVDSVLAAVASADGAAAHSQPALYSAGLTIRPGAEVVLGG